MVRFLNCLTLFVICLMQQLFDVQGKSLIAYLSQLLGKQVKNSVKKVAKTMPKTMPQRIVSKWEQEANKEMEANKLMMTSMTEEVNVP